MKIILLSLPLNHLIRLGINAVIAMGLTLASKAEEKVSSIDADSANTLSTPHIQSDFIPKTSSIRSIPSLAYTRTYGTKLNEQFAGITTDLLGNVYISGNSMDTYSNGFLRKYSSDGRLLWKVEKVATSIDGITLDKNANIYIAGSYVTGSGTTARHSIYLEKYDQNGDPLWKKIVRAAPASDPTFMIVNGLAADPRGNGSIIILFERAAWPYQSRSVFIRKYNISGIPIWEKPVGNSSPYNTRPVIATDRNGKIYTAINSSSYHRWNTRISQFDAQGEPIGSTSFFPADSLFMSHVHGISVDSLGNVYVVGITKAALVNQNLGLFDAFIRKYDPSLNPLWTRQFGTTADDYANGLTIDAADNVYIAGSSSGVMKSRNIGSFDAVMHKYGSDGNVFYTMQFGSSSFDIASGITLDIAGNLYIAGHTFGNLSARNHGGQDIYLRKYYTQ